MKIQEYVTIDEVKRVCKELCLSDWTTMQSPNVLLKKHQ